MGRVFANGPGYRVQSQVELSQRFLKWHLIPLCLTLSIIRYVSRVKWSHPGKRVAPSPTCRCSSYWKRSLLVTLEYGCQLYLLITILQFKYTVKEFQVLLQKQDDQLELTYSSYVKTQDVTLKTCRRRWMIGRSSEKGSGISVLTARHDDDDEVLLCISNNSIKHESFVYMKIKNQTVLFLKIQFNKSFDKHIQCQSV